jgi:FixJ family two-component response regulator
MVGQVGWFQCAQDVSGLSRGWQSIGGLDHRRFDSAEHFLVSGCAQNAAYLIVDVQLPGISGLELQDKLAGAGNRVPIIFVSAQGTQANRDMAMKHGAAGFFLSRSGGAIW